MSMVSLRDLPYRPERACVPSRSVSEHLALRRVPWATALHSVASPVDAATAFRDF